MMPISVSRGIGDMLRVCADDGGRIDCGEGMGIIAVDRATDS